MFHIKEAAFSAEAAVGAIGKEPLHFSLPAMEQGLNRSRVNRFHFLIRMGVIHMASPCLLPRPRSPTKTIFPSDEKSVEKEKEHMPEFGEGNRNEHDFS